MDYLLQKKKNTLYRTMNVPVSQQIMYLLVVAVMSWNPTLIGHYVVYIMFPNTKLLWRLYCYHEITEIHIFFFFFLS